ncbi:MAG: RcnB family protein [Sphingomonas phyllosphaerae]|uniref:RcnB family protein n=1 Tax=Sphingomonas phyllosphaerae TaxID=257003 RepID=UPI002FF4C063
MLKAMVAGLLSMTALVPPALAQDGRSMDRGQWRRERAERPTPPPEPAVRPAPAAEVARPPEPAPRRRAWQGTPERRDPARWQRDGERNDRRAAGLPRPPAPNGDWRSERAADARDDWQRDRVLQDRRDAARRAPDRDWSAEPGRRRYDRRDGPTPPAAVWRSERDGRWDRAWRREPRYDWSRYRDERRSAFRLPRYYAPYGWNGGYRRFGIGMPLAPMLYTPRYWIYDPYAYRLPDAEEPYRWVRYYDDALLVDIEDGTVVDVIHGIFD